MLGTNNCPVSTFIQSDSILLSLYDVWCVVRWGEVRCVDQADQARPCFGTKFDLIKGDDWNRSTGRLQHLSMLTQTDKSSNFSYVANLNKLELLRWQALQHRSELGWELLLFASVGDLQEQSLSKITLQCTVQGSPVFVLWPEMINSPPPSLYLIWCLWSKRCRHKTGTGTKILSCFLYIL